MRKPSARGFTLVELMVVLVVLAVAASMVMLSVSAASGHALESTAEELSSTLEETRWRAISTRQRITWEAPASATADGVVIRIAKPPPANDAPARLVLGPEPVGLPACVLLTQADSTVAIVSDGVAPFALQRDARC